MEYMKRQGEVTIYTSEVANCFFRNKIFQMEIFRGTPSRITECFFFCFSSSFQAYDIMKVTHGIEHSLMQDLMILKEEWEAGMILK